MSGVVEHGVDRSGSAAAAAAAASVATPGTATGDGAVISAPSGGVTDNALARWDGTTGLLIQNSTAILDDSGNLVVNTLDVVDAATTRANLGLGTMAVEAAADYLLIADIDDTPVNGATTTAISSNWAFDHEAAADPHPGYTTAAELVAYAQPLDADLTAIAALAVTDGNIIVGNGTTWVAENGATARTSLGLGTGDSPQFTAIELGHASDTTLARGGAGFVSVEGKNIPRITTGTSAPATTPTYVGELFINTAATTAYVSTGTASSSDWEQIDGGAGGAGASTDVTQTSHGFSVGNVLKYTSSGIYAKAQANTAANAEVVGIVSAVAGADDFTLLYIGRVTGMTGLTDGTVYFLDPSTAGALTATEPTTVGHISKPVFVATGTSNGVFVNWRGTTVGSATSKLSVKRFSGDGSTVNFTLDAAPVDENNTFVMVSGVYQQKDTYSVSGTTLTFSTAPPSGTDNIEVVTVGSVSIGTASATDAGATLTLGTEQASTSGTAIDFTGIPAGTKQIIVTLQGVSTNGAAQLLVQLGHSGGVVTSGYLSVLGWTTSGAAANATAIASGMAWAPTADIAARNIQGSVLLTLTDATNNGWVSQQGLAISDSSTNKAVMGGGSISALGGVLDRVRITTVGGTDTFDAGSINLAYK